MIRAGPDKTFQKLKCTPRGRNFVKSAFESGLSFLRNISFFINICKYLSMALLWLRPRPWLSVPRQEPRPCPWPRPHPWIFLYSGPPPTSSHGFEKMYSDQDEHAQDSETLAPFHSLLAASVGIVAGIAGWMSVCVGRRTCGPGLQSVGDLRTCHKQRMLGKKQYVIL